MTQFTISVEGSGLLRYLAAPRSFQFRYLRRSAIAYGYEGGESYGEARDGLALLLLVGEDFLARDLHVLEGKLPEGDARLESLFQACSLIRFVIESGEAMVSVMDIDDEAVIRTYASGVWQLLRRLARDVLGALALDAGPPDRSYEELFVSHCTALPA